MRGGLLYLGFLAVAVLLFIALLPLVGVLFLLVAAALVLAVGAYLAAPLLVRLPWFKNRITVEEYGGRRIIRFGGTSQQQPPRPPADDVIDVQGRELPADEDEKQ